MEEFVMIYLATFVMVAMVVSPLFFIYRRVQSGKKGKAPLMANFCCFFGLLLVGAVLCLSQAPTAMAAAEGAEDVAAGLSSGLAYIGAALAVGLSGIGGGIAVSAAASAALGAISENEKVFGKSLIFVGLAEGVALYGLLVALMIIANA